MMMQRRSLLAASLAVPALAHAQAEWRPTRPMTFIVPFGAGSGTDAVARVLGQMLSAELGGATITVDNRAGANGTIPAAAAMRAAPDGPTLFVTTNTTHAANQHLYVKLPYDPVKDFTPVILLNKGHMALMVNPASPSRRWAS